MAEAVGLAASIAGLIGITSQIGKGVLFLKGFLEDTKNAPDYIRSLAAELDLLGSSAAKADKLLVKCRDDGLEFDLEEEKKGLKRYAEMIEKLGTKIEKDVKKFGSGKGRWWERVGSAGRKKTADGYLVGVERAKTLVLDMEMKIMIQLQHDSRTSLINTNQTLEDLRVSSNGNTTTTELIEVQTSAITSWTRATDQTLGNALSGIERINSSLNTLSPLIQNLQHTSTVELSALDAMFESAVMRGLKRHNQEIENQQLPKNRTTTTPGFLDTPTEAKEPIHQQYSESYSMVRRDKKLYQSSFRTPFFDIEIGTIEVQRCSRSKAVQSTRRTGAKFEPTHSQRVTKYHVRVKIPFWRGGMTFQSGNMNMMYGGGFCKSFRTYNIVPGDAPIIRACRTFDLQEVRRLFEASLASPLDQEPISNYSLVDIVLREMAFDHSAFYPSILELLKFLIEQLGKVIGQLRTLFHVIFFASNYQRPQKILTAWAEACRLAIQYTSEDSLSILKYFFSTLIFSKTPICDVVMGQQDWVVDYTIDPNEDRQSADYGDYWFETEMQMLADPEALKLQRALKQGLQYIPFHMEFHDLFLDGIPLHLLLLVASDGMDDQDFQECVIARLVLILKSGVEPRGVYCLLNLDRYSREPLDPLSAFSCTALAQCLGLASLWRTSLERAGWSPAEIDDLFDEELYLGIPALIDGILCYQTRDEQRKDFIETLRGGGFVELGDSVVDSRKLEYQVGLDRFKIQKIIDDVTSVLKQRATPGSWNDDEVIKLMPGKDFEIP